MGAEFFDALETEIRRLYRGHAKFTLKAKDRDRLANIACDYKRQETLFLSALFESDVRQQLQTLAKLSTALQHGLETALAGDAGVRLGSLLVKHGREADVGFWLANSLAFASRRAEEVLQSRAQRGRPADEPLTPTTKW
jgi:hypothetical protein